MASPGTVEVTRVCSHEKCRTLGVFQKKLPEEHMDVRKCAVKSESLQAAKAAVEILGRKR